MQDCKLLSAADLLKKGLEKSERTLPIKGLKDITPSGSWIEQKEIQEALENRRLLLNDERVEKWGVLSQAEWDPALQRAHVTERRGSQWSYIGHMINKNMYLHPEEALFLMEMNCLLLKHCGVPCSLQQAYSLLLQGPITLRQYKVYSELSRVGYRVLRTVQKDDKKEENDEVEKAEERKMEEDNYAADLNDKAEENNCVIEAEFVESVTVDKMEISSENNNVGEVKESIEERNKDEVVGSSQDITENINQARDTDNNVENMETEDCQKTKNSLKLKSITSLKLPDYFQSVPNMVSINTMTVTVPSEDYLPRNVVPYKNEYTLKKDEIRSNDKGKLNNTKTYDMEKTNHAQICDNPVRELLMQQQMLKQYQMMRLANFTNGLANANQLLNPFFGAQLQIANNMLNAVRQNMTTNIQGNKKFEHLQAIRRISFRLKKLKRNGDHKEGVYLESLRKLIKAYNERYKEKLELSDNLTLRNDCDDSETVELEDEEAPKKKRKKIAQPENDTEKGRILQNLKMLALKLKNLRRSGEHCFKSRRSLLEAIKLYNRKFNEGVYLTNDYDVADAKQIVLDSSDSDCVITDLDTAENSFNQTMEAIDGIAIDDDIIPSTSNNNCVSLQPNSTEINDFYNQQSENFAKWLPNIDDWGRAEVQPSYLYQHRIINSNQEYILYRFLNSRNVDFIDWAHLKKEFWNSLEEQNKVEIPREIPPCNVEALLSPQDCIDLGAALERVKIVKTNTGCKTDVEMKATFDVYERYVKNFKKSDLPVPSFRLVILEEDAPMPSLEEVISLQQLYKDSCPVMLAVVGATVSYVLVSQSNLPQYQRKSFV